LCLGLGQGRSQSSSYFPCIYFSWPLVPPSLRAGKHLPSLNSSLFWHRSGGMSSRLMSEWQGRSPASARDSRLGMGIENRYHYGTGSRTTDTNGTESKRIFRFRIPVLEINCVLPPLGGRNLTSHTLTLRMRRHTPRSSKHFTRTATARTTQNAESKTVVSVAVFYTK